MLWIRATLHWLASVVASRSSRPNIVNDPWQTNPWQTNHSNRVILALGLNPARSPIATGGFFLGRNVNRDWYAKWLEA